MDAQFKYQGKKYVVNFKTFTVNDYDPGYRLLPDGTRRFTLLNKKKTRIKTKRYATVCIIRTRYTGVPYSGVAVLTPGDKWNWYTSSAIAAKKAIISLVYAEKMKDPRFTVSQMFRTYMASMEQDDAVRDQILREIDLVASKHAQMMKSHNK